MKCKPGHRWCIVLTLPESKGRFIVGGHEGHLALIPLEKDGKEQRVNRVLSWEDSLDAAIRWLWALVILFVPGFLYWKPIEMSGTLQGVFTLVLILFLLLTSVVWKSLGKVKD